MKYKKFVGSPQSGASPPSFRAIGSADAQDINRKPWTLYSAGAAALGIHNVIVALNL